MPQNNFSLAAALENVIDFPFANIIIAEDEYKKVIAAFANELTNI